VASATTVEMVRLALAADPEVSEECRAAVLEAVESGGWLRVGRACELLGVGRRALERWREKGLVQGRRVSRKVAVVRFADVVRRVDGGRA